MNKKMFSILIACLFCWSSLSFSEQNPSDEIGFISSEIAEILKKVNKENVEINTLMIETNAIFLESYINNKIKNAQKKLQRYQDHLEYFAQDDDSTPDLDYYLKKINSKQKQIKKWKEILIAIELLKLKIAD